MTASFTLTKRDLKDFYIRANLPSFIVWAAILLLSVILQFFRFDAFTIILLALVVIYIVNIIIKTVLAYRRSVNNDPHLTHQIVVEADGEGLSMSDGEKEGKFIEYLRMYSVLRTKRLLIFRLNPRSTMLLPRSALSEADGDALYLAAQSGIKEGKLLRKQNAKQSKSRK